MAEQPQQERIPADAPVIEYGGVPCRLVEAGLARRALHVSGLGLGEASFSADPESTKKIKRFRLMSAEEFAAAISEQDGLAGTDSSPQQRAA